MSLSLSSRHRAWGATVAFSATLVLGAVTPVMAGAAPAQSATSSAQTQSGSKGVNHNDSAPSANLNCTNTAGTSGTCTSPQPFSTADNTNKGANTTSGSNPYASTRTGAPSDNGSGTGVAGGKPCAGCVGNADNKNPAGQAPSGPLDHNNGYECDGNNGIGQGNPAHTGCTTTTTGTTSTTGTTGATGITVTSGTTGTTSTTGTTGATGTTVTPGTSGTTGATGTTVTPGTTTGTPETTGTGRFPEMSGTANTPATTPTGNTQPATPAGSVSASHGDLGSTSVLALEGSRSAAPSMSPATNSALTASPATEVLGLSASRPASAVAKTSGSLPFTGSSTLTLLEIAAGAMMIGLGSLAASRRLTPAQV